MAVQIDIIKIDPESGILFPEKNSFRNVFSTLFSSIVYRHDFLSIPTESAVHV